ncbi:hypothetical protein RR48_12247 [Papilio machaon]|uniref:Uncharacterized protein n=1 Tax=Papilio machaon TaxID=76193 RepID=A0A194QT49_PAPMA|nr:hypothetical protein RR48_12247 [Papilio machaon]
MASKECWCVLYLCILHSAFSFNLEPRIPVIKYGEKGSYFGFSVAEHLTINSTSGDKTSWRELEGEVDLAEERSYRKWELCPHQGAQSQDPHAGPVLVG